MKIVPFEPRHADGVNAHEKQAGRKFIRNRDHLLRRIGELCGEVDPAAVETIRSWPVGYVTWKLQEMHPRAGPETVPCGAISDQRAA